MWRIEFTSDRFLPSLPEDCQVNRGAYGFELALWLAQALASRGVTTSYPLGEDWGWLIEYADGAGVEVTVGCASVAEDGEGYRRAPLRWSVFVRPHRGLRRRRGDTVDAAVERLTREVVTVLDAEGIEVEHVE